MEAELVEAMADLRRGSRTLAPAEGRERAHLSRLQTRLQRVRVADRRHAGGATTSGSLPGSSSHSTASRSAARARSTTPFGATRLGKGACAGGNGPQPPTAGSKAVGGPLAAQHEHLRLALPPGVATATERPLRWSGQPDARRGTSPSTRRALGQRQLRLGGVLPEPMLVEQLGSPRQQPRRLTGQTRLSQDPRLVHQPDRVGAALVERLCLVHRGQRPGDPSRPGTRRSRGCAWPSSRGPGRPRVCATSTQCSRSARAVASDPTSRCAVPRLSRIDIWSSSSASSITSTAASSAASACSTRPPRSSSRPR